MATAAPFVWGSGGEPLTVEEAKARREEAARIIAQATSGKPIGHWTQGVSNVASAMMAALDAREATAGEKLGRESASKDLAGLTNSFLGGGSTPAAAPAAGGGTQAAAGNIPSFVSATGGNPTAAFQPISGDLAARKQLIVDGLVQRGLSPNAAAAYAGNFAIENNADPIGGVGDNGTAFGLAQWRKERFDALRSLAGSQGKDWRDLNVQLDHVVNEHKAMPSAYQQALATLDAGRGADLVMRQYERPSNKAIADTGAKRVAMALAAFNGFKPSGGAPAAAPAAPTMAEAPGVVAEGNPAAVADAQRVATEGGPRMVLSPQNPAVRLASGGVSDLPMPGIGMAARQNLSPGQFLVQQQQQRDQAPVPTAQQRIAQALPSAPVTPPAAGGNSRETIARAMKLMESPYASSGQKAVASAILQKALTAETPNYQRVESGGREGLFNPKTGQTQWTGQVPMSPKDAAELTGTRLSNEKKARELNNIEMEHLTGPDGKLYQRPKGTDEPWTVAREVGTKPSEEAPSLRKEIQNLPSYKNIAQAVPIYRSMVETAGRNSKASDLNLVYGLGKIMDPGSVVREGEMVMVKNTASLPQWFEGIANQLNGGGALTPETRKQLLMEAYGRMQGYQQQFQLDTEMYGQIADRGRLNRADIIPNFGDIQPWAGPPGVVTVKTPAEAMKLEPGTRFKGPDGREFVR